MKSLNTYLLESININEGLIKIPEALYMNVFEYVISQYFSYMYLQGYTNEAKALARNYKVNIDEKFDPTNEPILLDYVLDDLPEKIRNAWRFDIGQLKLVVDWESRVFYGNPKIRGKFGTTRNENGILVINPLSFKEIVNTGCDLDEIEKNIELLKWTICHELTHVVQKGSLRWLDPKQVHKDKSARLNPNSTKEERSKEYLTSFIEFDPKIKTSIGKFQEKFDLNDPNILKYLAAFVGAIQDNKIKPDEFFMALKEKDYKQWAKAVKKFYKYYNYSVEDLIGDNVS